MIKTAENMAILIFVYAAIAGIAFSQRVDVCSQVQLMHQYCGSQGVNGTSAGEVATMKALEKALDIKLRGIEARLRHTLGSPPDVNYTFVEETIAAKFQGVEQRVIAQLGEPPTVNYTAIDEGISARFRALEARVNGVGVDGSSIVDYARIIGQVDERYTGIRAYVDSKFARLVSDTDAYQAAMRSIEKQMNISDCTEISLEDAKLCNATGGVFDIYRGAKKYEVFCDSYTDGGGWTVFQRRMDGSTLFNRTWQEYVDGFGEPHREFWLGLKKIHELLHERVHELRIDLMDSSGRIRFAKYRTFYLVKTLNYHLRAAEYSGDAGNYFTSERPFSTTDRDHDGTPYNCAGQDNNGGWWYHVVRYDRNSNCKAIANLNAAYKNIFWTGFPNIRRVEMKFRPRLA